MPDNTNVTQKGGVFSFAPLSKKPRKPTFGCVDRSSGGGRARNGKKIKNKANLCRFMIDFFYKRSIISNGALKHAL